MYNVLYHVTVTKKKKKKKVNKIKTKLITDFVKFKLLPIGKFVSIKIFLASNLSISRPQSTILIFSTGILVTDNLFPCSKQT